MGKIINRIRARARNKLLAGVAATIAEMERVMDLEWEREEAEMLSQAKKVNEIVSEETLKWPSLRAERGEFIMPSYADWKF